MSDLLFQAWMIANGYDAQSWMPGLYRMLRRRFEKSQERLVIDGRDCSWPQRVYRVSQNENTPGE
jgi:hypothetical protein